MGLADCMDLFVPAHLTPRRNQVNENDSAEYQNSRRAEKLN